jgi:hypothetical protein
LTIKHELLTTLSCRRRTLEKHHVDEQDENGGSTRWAISNDVHWKHNVINDGGNFRDLAPCSLVDTD